jgi:ADP-ribose pyrophosphatase YjhB (NUDIX family)
MTDSRTEAGQPHVAVELLAIRTIEDQAHVLTVTEPTGPAFNLEALPGGFLRYQEKTTVAAVRVLAERTGLTIASSNLFYLGHYEQSYRHTVGWTLSFAYMIEADTLPGIVEAPLPEGAQWAPVAQLLDQMDRGHLLAYWGSAMVRDAAQVLACEELWPPSATKALGTDLRDRA